MDISMSRFPSRATPMLLMHDIHGCRVHRFTFHVSYMSIRADTSILLRLEPMRYVYPLDVEVYFCTRICAPFQLLDTQIVKQSVNMHFLNCSYFCITSLHGSLGYWLFTSNGQVDSKAAVRSRLLCWLRGWVRSVQCKRLSIMSCFWFVLAYFMFCSYVIASFEIHVSGLKAVFWPCGNLEAWALAEKGFTQLEIGFQQILGDEVAVGRLSVSSKEQLE